MSVFQDGKVTPVCVKVGDKVLLPEYGGTKVVLEDKVWTFVMIRSSDDWFVLLSLSISYKQWTSIHYFANFVALGFLV